MQLTLIMQKTKSVPLGEYVVYVGQRFNWAASGNGPATASCCLAADVRLPRSGSATPAATTESWRQPPLLPAPSPPPANSKHRSNRQSALNGSSLHGISGSRPFPPWRKKHRLSLCSPPVTLCSRAPASVRVVPTKAFSVRVHQGEQLPGCTGAAWSFKGMMLTQPGSKAKSTLSSVITWRCSVVGITLFRAWRIGTGTTERHGSDCAAVWDLLWMVACQLFSISPLWTSGSRAVMWCETHLECGQEHTVNVAGNTPWMWPGMLECWGEQHGSTILKTGTVSGTGKQQQQQQQNYNNKTISTVISEAAKHIGVESNKASITSAL